MDAIEQLIKTTLTELKSMVTPQTVFGDPVTVDGTTVIPVVKVRFGFGTGGGRGKKGSDDGGGGGAGAGANLTPVAFIIINAEGVRVELLKGDAEEGPSTVVKVVDAIATVINRRNKDESRSSDQTPEGQQPG